MKCEFEWGANIIHSDQRNKCPNLMFLPLRTVLKKPQSYEFFFSQECSFHLIPTKYRMNSNFIVNLVSYLGKVRILVCEEDHSYSGRISFCFDNIAAQSWQKINALYKESSLNPYLPWHFFIHDLVRNVCFHRTFLINIKPRAWHAKKRLLSYFSTCCLR